ncbi:hypothetical protein AB0E62_28170 [Streptomyces sp. NPDC038707]|uniref:hypothetical protein n=1 Tax=Streptomyces sp. NPDC038707 TaxID=3154329 RepID=UPI0033E9EB61
MPASFAVSSVKPCTACRRAQLTRCLAHLTYARLNTLTRRTMKYDIRLQAPQGAFSGSPAR